MPAGLAVGFAEALPPWAALALRLAAAQLLLIAGLLGLARLIGRMPRREAVAGAVLVPWLLLAPWVAGPRLLVPTGALAGQVPGTLAGATPDPHGEALVDVALQLLPWELEVRRALGRATLPLWSDTIDGGSSPWLNPQAAPLCPLALLARAVPLQHHLLAILLLKITTALLGAWLLARRLGVRPAGAAVAAIAYGAGGSFATWGLFPHSSVAAWVPWLAAASLGLARTGEGPALAGRRRAGAALAGAAVLAAGQPELAAGAVLFAGFTVAVATPRRRRMRALARLAVAGALAAALAAPLVVPFALSLEDTARVADRSTLPRAAEVVDARPFTWFRDYRGAQLLVPFHPWVLGRPFVDAFRGPVGWIDSEAGYAGLLPIGAALGGLGLAFAARRRAPSGGRTAPLGVGPWLLLAALLTIVAARFRPFDAALHAVPLLRIPHWGRFVPLASLALAIAAGMAVNAFRRWPRGGGRARTPFPAWAGCGLAVAISVAAGASWSLALLWSLALAALALARRLRGERLAALALAVALSLDLLPWTRLFLPRGEPHLFYPRTPEIEAVAAALRPERGERVLGQDLLVYPGIGSVYGFSDPRVHNPVALQRVVEVLGVALGFTPSEREYTSPVRRLDPAWLDALAVRVLVTNRYLPRAPGDWIEAGPPGGLFEVRVNPDPLPRWYWARSIAVEPDRRRRLAALATLPGGRGGVVVDRMTAAGSAVSVPAGAGAGAGSAAPDGAVRVDRGPEVSGPPWARWWSGGTVRLRFPPSAHGERAAPRLLATSVPGPRGWRALAAQGPLPLLEVNGAFLGVEVPADVEVLTLAYRPPGLAAGYGLAALGGAGLAVSLRRRRPRAPRGRGVA